MPKPEQLLPPSTLAAARMTWERAQRNRPPDSDAPRSLGATSLLGTLDAGVRAAKEAGRTGFVGLESITNPEIREKFEQDLASYETIFAGASLTMPTPEELTRGGIDFARLAELKETHPKHDLVVTPLTLPLDAVRQLVAAVTNDQSIPNNPLEKYDQTKTDSDGLYVNEEVVDAWDQIMQNTKTGWKLPVVNVEHPWTAFLLPSSDKPDSLGTSYAQIKQQRTATTPVVGYLAYQMHRIRQGLPPVDAKTWTWAEGEFTKAKGAAQAPYVYWSPGFSRVSVNWVGVSYSDGNLGVRSPVG